MWDQLKRRSTLTTVAILAAIGFASFVEFATGVDFFDTKIVEAIRHAPLGQALMPAEQRQQIE